MSRIVIINYGSQYTQLIKARLRELNYDAEILQPDATIHQLNNPAGIILSGSPYSVYQKNAPQISENLVRIIFEKETPTLAICYGMQLIAHYAAKGRYSAVSAGKSGQYGKTVLAISYNMGVLQGLSRQETVWMSHGDYVCLLPAGFQRLDPIKDRKYPENYPPMTMQHITKPIFGLQFHPEVSHTVNGKKILQNFLDICAVKPNWNSSKELQRMKEKTRVQIQDKHVFAFISTGNDSSVLARFLREIVPQERLHFCYVRGLSDYDEDLEKIELIGGNFIVIDARRRVLTVLKNITDPEEKREVIGGIFAAIWQEFIYDKNFGVNMAEICRNNGVNNRNNYLLAQGTIYPDIIESGKAHHADKIKSHHNTLVKADIEPFSNLFKGDVRQIGKLLGVPDRLITQHPSPGPGDAVRFLCSKYYISPPDDLYFQAMSCEYEIQEICKGFTPNRVEGWVLPIKSKGVQGDQGTYAYTAGLVGEYNREILLKLATEIPNKFSSQGGPASGRKGTINRVIYLIAPKDTTSLQFAGLKKDYFRAKTRNIVDKANKIFIKNLRLSNLYSQISQAFAVVCPLSLPCNGSHNGHSVILRAIDTEDFMTASPHWLPEPFLKRVASEIMSEIPEISMVFYDLTSKPPGTIEWE